MNKEEFLKELKKDLKYLSKAERNNILLTYENKEDYQNLDPIKIANDIYQEKKLNYLIRPKIKFLDALNIIVEKLKTKDKNIIINLSLFLLYLIFILIIIKIPFIYVRDTVATIFNRLVTDQVYGAYSLIFEIVYALTTISIYIRLIKNKALDLKKDKTPEAAK